MTTGELLDSESTVSNVSALIHLQNIEGMGGTCGSMAIRSSFGLKRLYHHFNPSVLPILFIAKNQRVLFASGGIIEKFNTQKMIIHFKKVSCD